jgi:hypothetical protein
MVSLSFEELFVELVIELLLVVVLLVSVELFLFIID